MHSNNRNLEISIGSALLSTSNRRDSVLMNTKLLILVTMLLTIAIAGCGKNRSPDDVTPPVRPELLPLASFSTLTDSVCGPDQPSVSSPNGFKLMWAPCPDADLAEWQIFFRRAYTMDSPILAGTHSAQLSGRTFVVVDSRILPNASTDSSYLYEYWINAVDQSGNVSEPSEVRRFELIRKLDGFTTEGADAGNPVFSGTYVISNPESSPDRYSLKLRNSEGRLVWHYEYSNYPSDGQILIRFNDDNTANRLYLRDNGRLMLGDYSARIEFWRQESAGSVSTLSFSVIR